MRYTRAEIDLDALDHNLRVCRRLSGGKAVLAVVKANGYGHGMIDVARRLEARGVEYLAVALVEEAVNLRDAGIRCPILLMFGVENREFGPLFDYELTPAIWTRAEAEALNAEALSRDRTVGIHLKIDTGMGRMGIRWTDAEKELGCCAGMNGLRIEGIMTHLASAESDDPGVTLAQLDRLRTFLEPLGKRGGPVPLVHAANSAGVLRFPESHFDGVRPGIMLYGYDPRPGERASELKPVMRWITRISHLKTVPTGMPLSYGGTFVTKRESRIATLPVGYGDGYPRLLSNRGYAQVGGERVPVVGTVCMDLILLDVTEVPDAAIGTEVVLMGPDPAAPDAWDIAEAVGTIPYEILTGVGARVPRVVKGLA